MIRKIRIMITYVQQFFTCGKRDRQLRDMHLREKRNEIGTNVLVIIYQSSDRAKKQFVLIVLCCLLFFFSG